MPIRIWSFQAGFGEVPLGWTDGVGAKIRRWTGFTPVRDKPVTGILRLTLATVEARRMRRVRRREIWAATEEPGVPFRETRAVACGCGRDRRRCSRDA